MITNPRVDLRLKLYTWPRHAASVCAPNCVAMEREIGAAVGAPGTRHPASPPGDTRGRGPVVCGLICSPDPARTDDR